jgi:hypothetical protein
MNNLKINLMIKRKNPFIDESYVQGNLTIIGQHIKLKCHKCGAFIKFISKQELFKIIKSHTKEEIELLKQAIDTLR